AHARTRGAVFQAGLWTSAASVCVLASFALFQGRFWTMETAAALAGAVLGGALLVPLLVLLVAPAFEWMFGYVTDIQLRELANFNHPLLKDLIVQAPGTYHHGIVIGAMVDAAAMQIGANPLLARVGAYYHDIGKGKNPLFFGENQKGENRHESIEPQMSARLIHRHVTDGVELARKAKLPQAVIDFIVQHHGTRLIGYFFHKAKEEAERKGEPPPPARRCACSSPCRRAWRESRAPRGGRAMRSGLRGVSRNVLLLGLVSLFGDVSSEMVVPLLPAFLVALGGGAEALGIIEGAAEATASLFKYFSGRWADRVRRLLPMAVAGYGLAAVVRPLLAIAQAPWHVF